MNYISFSSFCSSSRSSSIYTTTDVYICMCNLFFIYVFRSIHAYISKYHLNGFKCNNFRSFPPFTTKMHLYACV